VSKSRRPSEAQRQDHLLSFFEDQVLVLHSINPVAVTCSQLKIGSTRYTYHTAVLYEPDLVGDSKSVIFKPLDKRVCDFSAWKHFGHEQFGAQQLEVVLAKVVASYLSLLSHERFFILAVSSTFKAQDTVEASSILANLFMSQDCIQRKVFCTESLCTHLQLVLRQT
jgi:hypothetical protein